MKSLRSLIALTLLSGTFIIHGQEYSIPIAEIPVENLPDIAIASFDASGRPLVFYNPALVQQVGPAVAAFVKAHEYAHIKLGHAKATMFTQNPFLHTALAREAEIAADKFAAEYWSEHNPLVVDAAVELFSSPRTANLGDNSHLPTPVRAALIKKYAAAKQAGSTDSYPGDREQRIKECLREKQERCMKSCMEAWGYSYAKCKTEMCTLNEVNLAVWRPQCQRAVDKSSKPAVANEDTESSTSGSKRKSRDERIQECLLEKQERCLKSCMEAWGHSYERCKTELCTLNEVNLAVWRPQCEKAVDKRDRQ